jgi:CBS domain-containing protein
MPATVGEVMIQNVRTVDKEDTVSQAVNVMNRHEIGCVIVTENEKPLGILTERDILKRMVLDGKDPKKIKVGMVMSKPIVTVEPNLTVQKAAQIMLKRNIKKLVVTNGNHLVGILSLSDLIPLLEAEGAKLALDKAPKHVKQVFQIYYDPARQLRKTCPITMAKGMPVSCLGAKCMWYASDRCVFLNLIEKIT